MIILKFSLLLIFLTIEDVNSFTVNKCCPQGQILNKRLVCESSNLTNFLIDLPALKQDTNYGIMPCNLSDLTGKFTRSFEIESDGRLLLKDEPEEYSSEAYCLETSSKNVTAAFICPCKGRKACLRKCCWAKRRLAILPDHEIDCETNDGPDWRYDEVFNDKTVDYGMIYQIPTCEKQQLFLNASYEIFEDGSMYTVEGGLLGPEEYCMDYADSMERKVLACLGAPPLKAKYYLVSVFGLIGVILFALTTFIYLFVPGFPWLSSRMLGMHTGCMTMAGVILVINSINTSSVSGICYTLKFLMQFSFLAAFFWMNVMCIDVSWTFTGLRTQLSQRQDERRKFLFYSLYAWGCSSLLTLIAIAIEFSTFKPNMDVIKCWFKDDASLYLFFYGPMGVLILINLVLFVYTSVRIFVLKKGTKVLQQPESDQHGNKRNKQRFVLYAKLFSLMGVTWITEIISYASGDNYGLQYVWYITDSINLLRAVFIFIIFCCKRKVWSNIKKRHPSMKNCEAAIKRLSRAKIDVNKDVKNKKTSSTNATQESDSNKESNAVEMQPR